MTSKKEKLFKIVAYGNKVKVKNLTPGVDYMFHVKTVRGKDYSVSVMKKVATSKTRSRIKSLLYSLKKSNLF